MVGLLHLPPELHDMILQSAGFKELVALEYTSRYFAALCRRHWKTAKRSKKDLCWAARRGNLKVLRKVLQMLKPIDPKKMFPTHYEPYAGGSGLLYQAIYCYDASVKTVIHLLLAAKLGFELDYMSDGTWLREACDRQNYRATSAMLETGDVPPENLLLHCVSKIKRKSAGGHVPDRLVNECEELQERFVAQLVKTFRGRQEINGRPQKLESKTALMLAVCHGTPSMVGLLLRLGADPNVRAGHGDRHGTTALMHAIRMRKREAFSLLMDAGADIHQHTDGECAAYHLLTPRAVVDSCSGEIWTGLLKAGADVGRPVWLRDHRGTQYTILEQAVHEAFWGNSRPLDLIRDHAQGVDPVVLERAYGFLKGTMRWHDCTMADVRAALRREAKPKAKKVRFNLDCVEK